MCKWFSRNIWKIGVFLVIAAIFCFSKRVLIDAFEVREQLFYESVLENQEAEKISVTAESATVKPPCRTRDASRTATASIKTPQSVNVSNKKVFLYHLLCIIYICVLGATVAVLFVIFLKDDSGIRYEKLDELCKIREIISETISEKAISKETFESNQEISTDNAKAEKENKNENKTYTYAQPELLKHYMNCITEV